MKRISYLLLGLLFTTSCNEYSKVLKSSDYEMKYEYAKKSFEEGKYVRAYTLLDELVMIYKGTEKAQESLYLLARSYYLAEDYFTASQYFTSYYNSYPKGDYAELARFYAGYGYYLDSPEARLDQSGTVNAINEMQMFLEYFPNSEHAEEAQNIIFTAQEKLVEKELYNIRMYYDLGNYMGNNYESSIICARNTLREYPYTKYREEISMYMLRSKYREADQSVVEKKAERFRGVVDEYYTFINEFPEGKYAKEARHIFSVANKYIKD